MLRQAAGARVLLLRGAVAPVNPTLVLLISHGHPVTEVRMHHPGDDTTPPGRLRRPETAASPRYASYRC